MKVKREIFRRHCTVLEGSSHAKRAVFIRGRWHFFWTESCVYKVITVAGYLCTHLTRNCISPPRRKPRVAENRPTARKTRASDERPRLAKLRLPGARWIPNATRSRDHSSRNRRPRSPPRLFAFLRFSRLTASGESARIRCDSRAPTNASCPEWRASALEDPSTKSQRMSLKRKVHAPPYPPGSRTAESLVNFCAVALQKNVQTDAGRTLQHGSGSLEENEIGYGGLTRGQNSATYCGSFVHRC